MRYELAKAPILWPQRGNFDTWRPSRPIFRSGLINMDIYLVVQLPDKPASWTKIPIAPELTVAKIAAMQEQAEKETN